MVMSRQSRWLKRALSAVSALPTRGKHFNLQPMYLLDKWGHKLKMPQRYQSLICDEFDKWVGLYDDSDIDDVFAEEAEEDCS
jgi:hypothetical protein